MNHKIGQHAPLTPSPATEQSEVPLEGKVDMKIMSMKNISAYARVASMAAALACALTPLSASSMLVIADSVAEFSGTQGANNWYYMEKIGVAAPVNFVNYGPNPWLLPSPDWYTDPNPPDPTYTSLWDTGAHPGGTADGQTGLSVPVRRWVSEVTDTINISGTAQLLEWYPPYTGGTSVGIYINGVLLPGSAINLTPSGSNPNPTFNYSIDTPVTIGDTVDFILFSGINQDYTANVQSDATTFTAIISVPEPSSMALLGLGGAMLWLRRRKQQS